MPATAFQMDSWNTFTAREADTRDCIDLKRTYIDITGDLVSGTMLSQIVYWWLPREDGSSKLWVQKQGMYWLPMKHSDWAEFGIGEWQAASGLKRLKGLGLIETKRFMYKGAPTTHIRLLKKHLVASVQRTLDANARLRTLWEPTPVVPTEPPQEVPEDESPEIPAPSGTPESLDMEPEETGDSISKILEAEEEKNNIQPSESGSTEEASNAPEPVDVPVANFISQEEQQESVSLLTAEGIHRNVAAKLAASHPLEYIREKVALLHRQQALTNILTPTGWLVRAIQQDWRLEQGDGMASQRDSAPAPLPDTAAEIREELAQVDTARLSPEEVRKMVAGVFGEAPTEAAQDAPCEPSGEKTGEWSHGTFARALGRFGRERKV